MSTKVLLLQEEMKRLSTTSDEAGILPKQTWQLLKERDTLDSMAKKICKQLKAYNQDIQDYENKLASKLTAIRNADRLYGRHVQQVMKNAGRYFRALEPYFERKTRSPARKRAGRSPLQTLIHNCRYELKERHRQEPFERSNEGFLIMREEALNIFQQEWKRLKNEGKRLPHKLPLPEVRLQVVIAF